MMREALMDRMKARFESYCDIAEMVDDDGAGLRAEVELLACRSGEVFLCMTLGGSDEA